MPRDYETVPDDSDSPIDVADHGDDDYCSPSANGCWFCNRTIDEDERSAFSTEFDTFYHIECSERLDLEDSNTPVLDYERR